MPGPYEPGTQVGPPPHDRTWMHQLGNRSCKQREGESLTKENVLNDNVSGLLKDRTLVKFFSLFKILKMFLLP